MKWPIRVAALLARAVVLEALRAGRDTGRLPPELVDPLRDVLRGVKL